MIHRKSQILHPATGKPCPDIVRFTQATDDHTVRCTGMDKLTIFQIDPDMVRHFLPSFARPEKDQITFLQVDTADFLAIMLQHISRRTCQLLSIDFTKHNRHKTGIRTNSLPAQNRSNPLLSLSIHPSDEGRQAIWLLHCIKIYYRSESGGHHRDGKAPSVP